MNYIRKSLSIKKWVVRGFICGPHRSVFVRFYSKTEGIGTPHVQLSKLKVPPNLRAHGNKDVGPMGWLLLTIPIAAFGLGTWQVKRKKWKEDLIEALRTRPNLAPQPLPLEDSEIAALEFCPVKVKGYFEHEKEMFLGPRSCLEKGESRGGEGNLMSTPRNQKIGYLLVTPFVVTETNQRILINRGWIPVSEKIRANRFENEGPRGEVEVVGLVRLSEPKFAFVRPNKPDVRIWFCRDIEGMAEWVDARPVYLDATAGSSVPGGPIAGQTRVNLRNEHFSYILTWYSLSAATAAMWYFKFANNLRRI